MHICALCACVLPEEARKGYKLTATGVTDSCEPKCGCWELNQVFMRGSGLDHRIIIYPAQEIFDPLNWVFVILGYA